MWCCGKHQSPIMRILALKYETLKNTVYLYLFMEQCNHLGPNTNFMRKYLYDI